MRLAGLGNRLRADHVLGADQWQQIAEFGRVDDHAGRNSTVRRRREKSPKYGDDDRLGLGGRKLGTQVHAEPPSRIAAQQASIAATATFGSKATRLTQQLPG